MRKQTKVVAVASAAALLAIGGAMTSFAAQGWVEEDGTWYYYDKDGNRVEDEWKKSGDNWFWLDAENGGAMATDQIVEDDDDTYYVDANGVMVTNTWVKVVNEDQDDDEDPAEYRYYYMQSNGKAYKAADSGKVRFKTIDGKKYAFDEDGKMLYGWVNDDDSTLATDDSDWESATYYMGSWEDGSLKTGWQRINVYDDDKDDDYDYWFNFKANGKKRTDTDEKKLNGKYYGFDHRGVMIHEWYLDTSATDSNAASISNWQYFSSPEDGARYTKGWFKVTPPDPDDEDTTFLKDYGDTFADKDASDDEERWYYADGDGDLYYGEIKKIKGKYYGFWPEDGDKTGHMLTGLNALVTKGNKILDVISDDMGSDDLDDCMDGDGEFAIMYDHSQIEEKYGEGAIASLYYFGDNEDTDGALKTGSTTISLDGTSYSFYFEKSGGEENKGRGVTGIDDDKYIYKFGMKMKADSDDKYEVIFAYGDIGRKDSYVEEIDSAKLRELAVDAGQNKDGDTVRYVGTLGSETVNGVTGKYYLVNTSGNIQKNKTASKDGSDWYFYVDNKTIKMYTNNNTLSTNTDKYPNAGNVKDLKDDWKDKVINNGNNDDRDGYGFELDDIKDRDDN